MNIQELTGLNLCAVKIYFGKFLLFNKNNQQKTSFP